MDPMSMLMGGFSALGPALSGGPSSAASKSGDATTNILWSSPFMVGGTGNTASTDATQQNPAGGSGAPAATDILGSLMPLLLIAGAAAVAIAIVRKV